MKTQLLTLISLFFSLVLVQAQEGTIKDGKYTTIDKSVSIAIPKGLKKDGIKDKADGKGISAQTAFMHKDKSISCIFSTKIRKEYPKTDLILVRTAARYRQNIKVEDGSSLEFIEMSTLGKRKILISVVRHIEAGNASTFQDKWTKKKLLVRGDAIEARIYFVQNGYFIEFKYIIMPKLALNMSLQNENTIAKTALTKLRDWVCLSNVMTKVEKDLLLKYKFDKEYIRGIFIDPGLENIK